MSPNQNNQNANAPGLVAGHAQYVKAVAEETIGNVTGSHAWKSSGMQDKEQAVDAMKTAGESRDASKGFGGVEEKAGNLVGCEGMQKEGAESKKQ
ncbi:hypothetical protein BU26DRAFT_526002 [Trematosphaeria pertusa]|uniref:CsbD-like domain-containing protein n=1 Tax=Trematosphaeria pertusa TaxID=390896 RepID=A0A6A6HRP2_9PLEO|nr:uncharacterized protein BU26DRAFT_526002 [Trematosphaeria pertusa]KAF2240539.1 hypothetical protein BU26DRAFT_526002 [Trematosphaeria pertusa]